MTAECPEGGRSVLVPRDLLEGMRTSSARSRRLLVTLAVLWGTPAYSDTKAIRQLWASSHLDRPGRPGLGAILLELQAMGVCHGIEVVDDKLIRVQLGPEGRMGAA